MPKIIDMHTHVFPPEIAADPSWRGDCPLEIEKLLDAHEKAGIDFCVVTNPIHYLKGMSDFDALTAIQRWNAYGAELQCKYSGRIVVFASSIPGGGDGFNREFENAIQQFGLRGCFINSSHHGHYPDEDAARPFFELAVQLNVPVMIHAPASSFGEECMNMYRLISSVGRPMDESLAIARMIVRGVFEQLPDLKLICAHVGGGICEIIPRMDVAYTLGDYAHFLGSYEPLLISKKPSEYLKLMYLDTVSYHSPVIKLGIETVGIEHIVFGSDAPPLTPLLPRAREIIEQLDIPETGRQAIFSGNLQRIVRLNAGPVEVS